MKIQSVNDWRDEVSKLLSDLSDKLLSAKSLAIENDSSHCLVELESALMLVDQLKSMIATKRSMFRDEWKFVLEILMFVVDQIGKFNTSFNCQITIYKYGNWLIIKNTSYYRRFISNETCFRVKYSSYIPISN